MMTWFWQRKEKKPAGYTPYTTLFDTEVTGESLTNDLSPAEYETWLEQVQTFQAATESIRTRASLEAINALDTVLAKNPDVAKSTVASMVIDHSGSLKGQRAILACLIAHVVADFWSRLGIRYEILGFTTSRWKGGMSRERWLNLGRPENPGRLNDLLHIRYREASETTPGAPWAIHHLLRNGLLKKISTAKQSLGLRNACPNWALKEAIYW